MGGVAGLDSFEQERIGDRAVGRRTEERETKRFGGLKCKCARNLVVVLRVDLQQSEGLSANWRDGRRTSRRQDTPYFYSRDIDRLKTIFTSFKKIEKNHGRG